MVVSFRFASDKEDGVSFFTQAGVPVIMLNSQTPGCRHRFTLAHELGHILMHHHIAPEKDRDFELEANMFASELLVPDREFKPGMYREIAQWGSLKRYWGISIAALLFKAKQKKCLPEEEYIRLLRKMRALGYSKAEPIVFDIDVESTKLVGNVIECCFKSVLDSNIDYLREVSGLSLDDFIRFFHYRHLGDEFRPTLRLVKGEMINNQKYDAEEVVSVTNLSDQYLRKVTD